MAAHAMSTALAVRRATSKFKSLMSSARSPENTRGPTKLRLRVTVEVPSHCREAGTVYYTVLVRLATNAKLEAATFQPQAWLIRRRHAEFLMRTHLGAHRHAHVHACTDTMNSWRLITPSPTHGPLKHWHRRHCRRSCTQRRRFTRGVLRSHSTFLHCSVRPTA